MTLSPRAIAVLTILLALPAGPSPAAAPSQRSVSVVMFGAIADGKTDCRQPIQKAIASVAAAGGGIVRFPKSDKPYLVGGTITLTSSDVVLLGPGATIKLADGAANGTRGQRTTESQVHVIRVTGTPQRKLRNIGIKGLTIDANIHRQADFYNPRAIVIERAEHVLVADVTIVRTFVGLDFGAGSSHCEARNCIIHDWTEDGFDASGDADKGSGAITTDIRFVNCHARGAPNSTGNAWEIEDGVRRVRVVDCSVTDVPRGNAFGIRHHWTAGPIDVSSDIELRRVTIKNVGGKYGIYSNSAPRDRFPTNRLTDVRLHDVICPAPVLFYGPMENILIEGGKYGTIHLGWDYGSKSKPNPGDPRPLVNTTVRIRNAQAGHINIFAQSGNFDFHNLLIDATGDHAFNIFEGTRVRIAGCTLTGAAKAAIALHGQAAPKIVNTILWGNPRPFATEVGKPSLDHCCVQGGVPRVAIDKGGNVASDPLFTKGPRGTFYLADTASGQKKSSPCINSGSGLAAFLRLDEFTTRTDRIRDTKTVDIGFHHSLDSAPRHPATKRKNR
ncbi:MAG: hypothetical protein CMJ65_02290 [Planctomycetaceae bacterium]|nr:hypothetical protein [Planctomycetaceae bacterium]